MKSLCKVSVPGLHSSIRRRAERAGRRRERGKGRRGPRGAWLTYLENVLDVVFDVRGVLAPDVACESSLRGGGERRRVLPSPESRRGRPRRGRGSGREGQPPPCDYQGSRRQRPGRLVPSHLPRLLRARFIPRSATVALRRHGSRGTSTRAHVPPAPHPRRLDTPHRDHLSPPATLRRLRSPSAPLAQPVFSISQVLDEDPDMRERHCGSCRAVGGLSFEGDASACYEANRGPPSV